MRKNFLMGILILLLLIYPLGAFPTTLEVSVTSAGNLVNQVDLTQIDKITNLTLHGELNGTDILVIRKMKDLEYLDMTDTKIVNGGDSYYEEYISSENTIGSYFFNNPNLSTVYLPNTITTIGESAFYGFSSLTNITIPNTVEKIGISAFSGCTGLTSITIPNSVTSIGESAFGGCVNLKKLDMEGPNPKSISIGTRTFYSCPLEEITLGRNLSYDFDMDDYYTESLRKSPFSRKSTLKSVVIEPSVTFLGIFLFYDCTGITEITIPNSVTKIGIEAFSGCTSLKKLILESGNEALELKGIKLPYSPSTHTFDGCPLEEIFLGRTLNYDDEYGAVFERMETLKLLTISDNVTQIANNEFFRTSIECLTIPESVEKIGYGAFGRCEKLKKIIFEDGQTELSLNGGMTFSECPLETLYLGRNLNYYFSDSAPFKRNTTLQMLIIGNLVHVICQDAFSGCINLKSVEMSNSVSTIEKGAFQDCKELSSFTFPQSLTNIFERTFSGCTKLQSVDLPNSVTTIGDKAFMDCVNLCSVSMPNTLSEIGNGAFDGCAALKSVDLPNTLISIGNSAFGGCMSLTSITLPSSIHEIGASAFDGCVALTEVNSLNTTPPTIQENTFDENTYGKAILNVPFGCKTIYWLHPYWENFSNIAEKDFPTTGIIQTITENTDYGYNIDNDGITFTKDGESVKIYTIQGTLFYSGKSSIGQTVELTPNAIYIIKVGEHATKVAF